MNTPLKSCHVMAKPASSKCNIDCSYCFYLEKEKLYPNAGEHWKMDDATLEKYVVQQIEAQDTEQVVFAWQGGEPTLLGVDFFRRAVALQNKYGKSKKIINTLQTNGISLTNEWCDFFKQNNFLIGISIDGPKEFHDTYRKTRSGKATHDKVVEAIRLLKQFNVEFNALTVVSQANARAPQEVYRYLKALGIHYMQFIPLVERKAQQKTKDGLTLLHPERLEKVALCDWSVDAEQYGLFMSAIFHEWVRKDIGHTWVQLFENTFSLTCKQPSQLCVFSPTCGSAFALESSGDIYACDHYVYPEFKLGNIHQISISEVNEHPINREFGLNKKLTLSQDCRSCDYLTLCNGGCPKHRFAFSSSGKPDQNYLCAGYKTFFSFSAPYMKLMRDLMEGGHPPSAIMKLIAKKEGHQG